MRVVAAAQARKAATDSTEAASQLYARDQLLKQLLRAKSQEEVIQTHMYLNLFGAFSDASA